MKKTFLVIVALLACIFFSSCGTKTGTVKLNIDDDVIVSKIIIAKSESGGYKTYSEKSVNLKKGDTFERTMGKGSYCFFMEAKGGPTYTKDSNKMYKINVYYCQLSFELIDGETTEVNFSQMKPNVMYYSVK